MEIQHGRLSLSLSQLRAGGEPNLLLLHQLGGSAADFAARERELDWPGAVHALDFCGHGCSGWIVGGSYCPELLVADADAVLARIGAAFVAGEGLGAYVGLLLAAGRRQLVPGVALLDGAGIAGAGAEPDLDRAPPPLAPLQPAQVRRELQTEPRTDPAAVACLADDLRPSDYALQFAAAATRVVLADDGRDKPAWWRAVAAVAGVTRVPGALAAALHALRAPTL